MRRLAVAVVLLISVALSAQETPKTKPHNPVGLWLGVLKIGPIQLRLVFRVDADKAEKTKFTGALFSIDQTDIEIPLDKVAFDDGKFSLEVAKLAVTYSGKFDAAGAVDGTFKQGALTLPLRLDRIDKMPTLNRPQTPKAPFPYRSEEVVFENPTGKLKLAGTLTTPDGDGPFPAVVLVSGSGPQDRDETIFNHKPFLVLADHFARNGIATLRYDDRGVFKSKGTFSGATSKDFAEDAEAAALFLKERKKIDPKRIGICGHSEGGLIAPMVAVGRPDDIAFIILLAGTGVPGATIFTEQITDFSRLGGEKVSDDDIAEFIKVLIAVTKPETVPKDMNDSLKAVLEKIAAKQGPDAKEKVSQTVDALSARLRDPWMRWFVRHDPSSVLKKVTCPILAVNGEKDIQVKSKQNLDAIRAATKDNENVTLVEFKGLNHLFQTCTTGHISEYGQIEETIAPAVLRRLSDWIRERK